MSVSLVDVTRSNVVESIHYGDVVVVDNKGNTLFQSGDSERLTFFRSSAKPIIAVASLASGIVEKFGLTLKEIATITSSHRGEEEHIKVIEGMMDKIGINRSTLLCGIREPNSKEAAKELTARGESPSELHCNCSGKHVGIIASVIAKGLPVEGYLSYEHMIGKYIEGVVSDFCGMKPQDIIKGIDGCGLTVYAIPLKNMAFSYANLVDESFKDYKYEKSQNYVLRAMTSHPEMVAGNGHLDTELMRLTGDRLIGKSGAEGVYCAGIREKGIGIALKIADGNSRAVGPVILELLFRMGIINADELDKLKEFYNPSILNNRDERVGDLRVSSESGLLVGRILI